MALADEPVALVLRRRALRSALRLALGARLPRYEGELRLPGLHERVSIRRDRYAIPSIEATNDEDAWFGLGFCQGQERAFQLELRLRTVRGTLSALIGKATLEIDRLTRRIGLRESAERQLPVLDPALRANVEAFARGINAGIAHGLPRLPHEFVLLRGRPSNWDGADVLGIGKLMSLLLIGNWDVELARLQILRLDGERALQDLSPVYPEHHGVAIEPGGAAGPALDRLSDDLALLTSFAGRSGGSNSWVLAGSKTSTGRPLLANDPHLEPHLPPHWYLARIKTPRWQVAGASLVGGPAIGVGHNGVAAWGITAGLIDTVDLFLEEIGPDGSSVREGDDFVPCESRREVIEVRGGAPVVEDVLVTRRGPIIGPALRGEVGAISMSAVWLQARPARGFLSSFEARSFEAFRGEFRQWPLLNQNVVYADTGGTIGWQLVGEAPLRRKGWGSIPLPGWDPDAGWQPETLPFEQMPFAVDPQGGYLASANSKPARDGEGAYLGSDWLDGYRYARISEVLATRNDWDTPSSQRLQLDETTVAWRDVREALMSLPVQTDAGRNALQLLRAWDGVLAADSAAAAVYELFLAEAWQRIARNRAPKAYEWAMGRGFAALLPITTFASGRSSHILGLLARQPDGWFEHGWPAELADALDAAAGELVRRAGTDPSRWAWGKLRPLTLQHPVGQVKALAPLFNRGPFPYGGDGNTLAQAGLTVLQPLSNPLVVPSLRAVIDVGQWGESRFAMPGGQSGNPLSPHYDDLLPFWRRGEGVLIAWSEDEVATSTQYTLELGPL